MQQFSTHMKTSLFLLTLASSSMHATSPSFLRYLLGSKPVGESVQQIADRADAVTGFKTPVLGMNRLGKLFGYSTFNWFNTTWVNEEAVQEECPHMLTWQLIHEKWHSLARHDMRRIIGIGALLLTVFGTVQNHIKKMKAFEQLTEMATWDGDIDFPSYPYPFLNMALILVTIFAYLWHEEYCENAADQYADRIFVQMPILENEKDSCPINRS